MQKKSTKGLSWLMSRCEQCQERYLEDEKFLQDYINLPMWKRILFGNSIIINHLVKMKEKYPEIVNLFEE